MTDKPPARGQGQRSLFNPSTDAPNGSDAVTGDSTALEGRKRAGRRRMRDQDPETIQKYLTARLERAAVKKWVKVLAVAEEREAVNEAVAHLRSMATGAHTPEVRAFADKALETGGFK